MAAIAHFVDLRAAPEKTGDLRDLVSALAERSRDDGGCLRYDAYDLDDGRIRIVEVWSDESAFQAHVGATHTADAMAAFPTLLVEAPVVTIGSPLSPAERSS